MKRLIFYLASLFFSISAFAQNTWVDNGTRVGAGFNVLTAMPPDANSVYEKLADTSTVARKYESKTVWFKDVKQFWTWNGKGWRQNAGGGGSDEYNGNYLTTSSPNVGYNYGGTTVQEFLDNVFKQTVAPQCELSLNYSILEITHEGDIDVTAYWTAIRPNGCTAIQSININGAEITPTGDTQTGTLVLTLPNNYSRLVNMFVSSTDKGSECRAELIFSWKQYWGASDTKYLSNDDILRLTGAGIGSGNEFARTFVRSYNGINGGGKYLVFAFPDDWGVPQFVINGIVNTAFTKSVMTFTNATGGVTNYQVWVSNTPQFSPIANFLIRKANED